MAGSKYAPLMTNVFWEPLNTKLEHASEYCPTCGLKLEAMKCKLVCTECKYYMSCSDYV